MNAETDLLYKPIYGAWRCYNVNGHDREPSKPWFRWSQLNHDHGHGFDGRLCFPSLSIYK